MPAFSPRPGQRRGLSHTRREAVTVVDATVEYTLGEDGATASLSVNVIVDEDATAEQAALCVGAAKALSIEAHRTAEAMAARAPDDASSITE